MRTFTVNNHLYQAKEFDFNLLCELEENNLSLDDIDKKPMSLIRYYLAFCGNMSKEKAGAEIEAHVKNGGKFNTVVEAMAEQMQNSDFFQALNKETEAATDETSSESPKKTQKA